MGRPRLPANQQKGHINVVDMQRMQAAEKLVAGETKLKTTPPTECIDDAAKKEWRRVVKILRSIGTDTVVDRSGLIGYVNAWSNYTRVSKQFADEGFEYTITSDKGTVIANPLVGVQCKYGEEVRKFAAQCGLTLDSRLKAGNAKLDKQEQSIESRFGNI